MFSPKYLVIKSKADFILGIIIILITLPFTLLVSVVLTVILKSWPLIVQERGITIENKIFKIYKFKTIKPNIGCYGIIATENILFKPHLAEYVPVFCKWLRKSGLDELPQIINVLKGEMGLIGPRPLTISDLGLIKVNNGEDYSMRNKIKTKPGITGLWQVFGDRRKGIENLVTLDCYYEKKLSAVLDLKIALSTIKIILMGQHSDAILLGDDMELENNIYPAEKFNIS